MKMIAAVDARWGIGRKNQLLVSIPADMKAFRAASTGQVIVVGRKTLESFPGGKPLKGRVNLVLTGDRNYRAEGATVLHSVEDVLKELEKYPDREAWCIGGGSIYRQFLPFTDEVHVTKIEHVYEADTFFPDLDADPEWEITGISEEQTYFDLVYHFVRYERCRSRAI